MKKQVIKIMPDYECSPIWHSGYLVGNVDPDDLPITEELKTLLDDWQNKFDLTLNLDYPPDSGFKTVREENEFKKQGLKIYEMMTRELGENYEIHYFNVFSRRLYKSFEELR